MRVPFLKAGLCAALALLLALASAAGLSAQTVTTGTITGVVMDAQGGVLPGAGVVATHVPTGTVYEALTQADGRFTMMAVRVGGPYTVVVTMDGFRTEQVSNVSVSLGESRDVKVTMQLATVTETVNVVAEAQIIDPARAGTAQNVPVDTLQTLPTIARSITDYARLSPHFVVTPVGNDAQAFSVAGRNERYNNIQIDGAVNNDVFGLASSGTPGGQASTEPISLDAIQELQLVVSAYDVRQGGFSGGSVNAITKGGTNDFHGTGYYYGRNQKLVGKGPNDRAFGTFSNRDFGASLGGPIARNRAFFFGNFEISRRDTPAGTSISGSGANFGHVEEVDRFLSILKNKYNYDPGSKEEFTKTTDSDKVFVRADMNIGGRHQLTVRHNYVHGVNDIGSPSVRSYIFPDNFYQFNSKTNSTVAQINSTFGQFFNEFRFTLQRIREFRDRPEFAAFPQVSVNLSDNTSVKAGREQYSAANALDQDIYELTDDLVFVRGKHTVTIGTHNEFYKFRNLFIRDNFGTYSFDSLDLFEQGMAQSYDYSYGTFEPDFAARFRIRQFALYAGDQFRVNDRLSLNLGVRLDASSFPDRPTANPLAVETYGYATDVTPSPKMWSPRVGFNWRMRDSVREQLRGGVGLFSGRTPGVWLSNQYGNTGIEVSRIRVTFGSTKRIPFVHDPMNQPKTVTGMQSVAGEIDMIDPDYVFPQLVRGNLAYDRELGLFGLVGTAEFLFSSTVNDIKYQNLNLKATGATRPDGRPVYTRVAPSLGDAIFLTNTSEGRQWSLSFKVEKPWKNGFYASASYLHNRAYAISDGTSSQAASNWGYLAVPGDPNNPPLTVSNFDVRHRINIGGSYDVRFRGVSTTFSLFYNGQAGRPYSLGFYQDVNGDGRTSNDLLYVPANVSEVVVTKGTPDQLQQWLADDPCAMESAGRVQQRNSCRLPWTNQVDFRLAMGIPLAGSRKVDLTFDVFNFMNLFNKEWGKVSYLSYLLNTDLRYGGIDAASGKMIYDIGTITSPSYQGRYILDDVRSRFQAKFGARFRF
ncbi:MAG: TonB-dependent receptor domain-containing protein [Vicinamibacterales bacterium]